jgi:hypothetical protein
VKGKECILVADKECTDCGKCEICDLDPNKICDNCCHCVETADYKAIAITKIILPETIKLKRKKSSPQIKE